MEHKLFCKLFGHPRDVFEGRAELLAPTPSRVGDPHPTRRYPDQKVWVWIPFSCLIVFGNLFQFAPISSLIWSDCFQNKSEQTPFCRPSPCKPLKKYPFETSHRDQTMYSQEFVFPSSSLHLVDLYAATYSLPTLPMFEVVHRLHVLAPDEMALCQTLSLCL